MSIEKLRKTLNLEPGGTLSSYEITFSTAPTLAKEVTLGKGPLTGWLDLLSTSNAAVEIEYNSDHASIIIPLTASFLKTFSNPLIPANSCRTEALGLEIYESFRAFINTHKNMPHFLKLNAHSYEFSEQELSIEEKLPRHIIDIGNYDKKGLVIGASLHLEALVTKATSESLKNSKAKISWESRMREKERNKKYSKPDFNDYIRHLVEIGIISEKIRKALDSLRHARNVSAHNFTIFEKEKNNLPFDYIEVTQEDKEFIKAVKDFIRHCRNIYGEHPKGYGHDKFKRYTELLAGSISKLAKVESVHHLYFEYSKDLEDIFG
ncbi:DUF4145 domain-containing protein [Pseudomonas sp. xss_1]|uniref:DUF4145 domain-containing protein n=1 Tax=Pseudomonas sp. xss_1 TaxID=3367214 RepID=UPI00370C133A